MNISMREILENAPDVVEEAKKQERINPYITLKELNEICDNSDLREQLNRVVLSSLRYTETVIRFEQIVRRDSGKNDEKSVESRDEIERLRTSSHDVVIDDINILSRMIKESGNDNSWISKVSIGGRPSYMKFAILIAFETVLSF